MKLIFSIAELPKIEWHYNIQVYRCLRTFKIKLLSSSAVFDLFLQVLISKPHPPCSSRVPLMLLLSTSSLQLKSNARWLLKNHVKKWTTCFTVCSPSASHHGSSYGYAVASCMGVENHCNLWLLIFWCDQFLFFTSVSVNTVLVQLLHYMTLFNLYSE